MAELKPGMYVRCPLKLEEVDEFWPRTFVLGMVREVDKTASKVRVRFFDLFDSEFIYGWAKARDTFPLDKTKRAESPAGFPCRVQLKEKELDGKIIMTRPGETPEDFVSYLIEFEDGKIRKIPENQVKLDFTGVDYHPLKAMNNYEFQNPTWFGSRYTVSSTMHVLNNAVYGFRILAGCRTFMMTHQVTTVLRALQSDQIRFMLADEVGMGKTIEACSIIKVQKERFKKYRTAYIVPDQLVGQWQFELSSKFGIRAEIASLLLSTKVQDVIIPLSELMKYIPLLRKSNFDMLVVDETHKILKHPERYDLIQNLSASYKNILLLSATPVTARKEEYKRLLSLLDPDRYLKMSKEQFDWLVSKQHDLGDKLYELYNWVQEYADYAEDIWRDLREVQEMLEDNSLKQMIDESLDKPSEEGKECALRILAYISEEYRMEKNIIRNRRGILDMSPRKKREISYQMDSDSQGYAEYDTMEALLDWLEQKKAGLSDEVMQDLLGAMFSSPWALREAFRRHSLVPDRHLDLMLDKWQSAAEAEVESVDALMDDPDLIHGRLLKAYDYLEWETDLKVNTRPFKGVVFTNYPETLDKFAELCRKRLGDKTVAVLRTGMNHEELEEEANRFQSSPECRLIICDPIGTEGRNLQNAHMMVHLDTPWDVGQMEQRIGRLDRIGRPVELEVRSLVIYAEDTMEQQLYQLWDEGMHVYTESLCGLEIILDTILEMMMKAIRGDLHYGLQEAMDEIRSQKDELDWELEKEKFFDMASILYHPLQLTIQNMLDVYQNKEDTIFAEAMMSWASQAGFNGEKKYNDAEQDLGIVEFSENKFSPKATTNAFLIPPRWSFYHIKAGAITGTFNRKKAIEQEKLLFFAPGDQVFDHITDNAMTCSKGKSCAFEMDSAPFDYRGLVMIWNVAPQMYYLYKNQVDPILMAKFRAYLPLEQIITLWPEHEGYEDVTPEMMDELFRDRRAIHDCNHLGKRGYEHLRGCRPIEQFQAEYPQAEWRAWLKEAYKGCQEKAREEVRNRWNIDTARAEATRIVNAQAAVNHYYGQDIAKVENLNLKYACLIKALENFQVKLDAIAYVRTETHGHH